MHNIFFTISFLLTLALAVPLNINLGAYSPALVVGDGEISFTGKQDVATLMNALEGAAVSAAANNAAAVPAAAAPAAPAAEGATEAKGVAPAGNVVPVSPASQDPNTAAIAAMQTGVGLGNDLEPRADTVLSAAKREEQPAKRDLAGFDRALNYATGALKSAPGVELGTGEGGSGVGIKQLPGGQAAVVKAGKRDLAPIKRRNRVTTLLVRGIDFNDGKSLPVCQVR